MTFWDEIAGHDRQKELFRESLVQERVAHANLFEGPSGVGKRLFAQEAARVLLCRDSVRGLPCEKCAACRRGKASLHPDYREISPNEKSHIVIAEIRKMASGVAMKPFEGASRVVIIDEAHKMNPDAQNALLKVLEEPPNGTYFFLITSNVKAILPTVLSRCSRMRFEALSDDQLRMILKRLKPESAGESGRLAGRARGSLEEFARWERMERLGVEKDVFGLAENCHTGRPEGIPAIGEDREKARAFVETARLLYRDLWVRKVDPEGEERIFFADRITDLDRLASKYTDDQLFGILTRLGEAEEDLERSVQARALFPDLWDRMGLINLSEAAG